jgi:hypothetical protein
VISFACCWSKNSVLIQNNVSLSVVVDAALGNDGLEIMVFILQVQDAYLSE